MQRIKNHKKNRLKTDLFPFPLARMIRKEVFKYLVKKINKMILHARELSFCHKI